MNSAVILIGSNIDPQKYIRDSFHHLKKMVEIISYSKIWKTKSFGNIGPDFLNFAVKVRTDFSRDELKIQVHNAIEEKLGRIRSDDKNAPRTIDLDTVIFNDEIIDEDLWRKLFIALPVSEIEPLLVHPTTKSTLSEIVEKLKSSGHAELFDTQEGFFSD